MIGCVVIVLCIHNVWCEHFDEVRKKNTGENTGKKNNREQLKFQLTLLIIKTFGIYFAKITVNRETLPLYEDVHRKS